MPNEAPAGGGLAVELHPGGPISLDLGFAVAPGEVLALVGPSGSGKSTVLRAIAGLYASAHGRIVCNGSVWLDSELGMCVPARDRRVGMMFQSYALFPHLTAVENVMEALGDLPPKERDGQARGLLARMHLEGLEDRYPALLSGGQQQRVAIARALARRPDILLLDEPFSAVDRVMRRRLRRELMDLRRVLPMPVILVTHDLDDVGRLADRMCVLHSGRILQSGVVEEVMACPASITVAELLDVSSEAGAVGEVEDVATPLWECVRTVE